MLSSVCFIYISWLCKHSQQNTSFTRKLQFDFENSDENDRPYIKMPEQTIRLRRAENRERAGSGGISLNPGEDILGRKDDDGGFGGGGGRLHKEDFSLLF